jgi:hypothetical protein
MRPEGVAELLDHLDVIDRTIVFNDEEVARHAVELFSVMNRDWWASPTEAYIYNEFADALREGFRLGILHQRDLLRDDAHVLACLRSARNPLITEKLDRIEHYDPTRINGFVPRVIPKTRWLEPPVRTGPGSFRRLSERP